MKNKNLIIIIIASVVVLSIAFTTVYYYLSKNGKSEEVDVYKKVESQTVENVENIESVAKDSNIKDVDFSDKESYAVELEETYKITKGGVYILTGTIEDGFVSVETEDSVKLILKNVKIKNSSGPAIYILNADKVYIELAEGSENYLEDGEKYNLEDEDVNSTIYSKDDLVLTGKGKLTIKANYKDAIVSKDDLKIENGTYIITWVDDAIRGKDSVVIENGNFDITSGGDAIKSTNDTDENKGYIYISNGTYKIKSEGDGISATKDVTIIDGNFNIVTSGGAESASNNKSRDSFKNFKVQTVETAENLADEKSTKGIKAENNVIIKGGTFKINTKDDSIHSNNYIGIQGGNFDIASGDDGMHADLKLIVDSGNIDITKSYEGLEAENITINGGNITINSTDDGINVAGGAGSGFMFMGKNNINNSQAGNTSNSLLTINEGYVYINASGDGLDSNGSININDGTIIVNGPIDNGNTAIDYEYDCVVNGGLLVASGSSGMVEGVSASSKQGFISANISVNAGDIITVKDSSGEEILTYASKKNYSNLILSSNKIKNGETYTVYTNVKTNSKETNGVYEKGGFISGEKSTEVNAGENIKGSFGGMQGGRNMPFSNDQNMMPNDMPEDMNQNSQFNIENNQRGSKDRGNMN